MYPQAEVAAPVVSAALPDRETPLAIGGTQVTVVIGLQSFVQWGGLFPSRAAASNTASGGMTAQPSIGRSDGVGDAIGRVAVQDIQLGGHQGAEHGYGLVLPALHVHTCLRRRVRSTADGHGCRPHAKMIL